MKAIKTCLTFVVLIIIINSYASNNWRVSKDATYLPHFNELQLAIDSAVTGDTIYVYPGSYGNIIIKKKITVLGVGYFLLENRNDSISTFITSTNLGSITFKPGSDNSSILGTISDIITCDTVSNLYLSGLKAVGILLNNCNNVIVSKNFLSNSFSMVKSNSVIVGNNIILNSVVLDEYSSVKLFNNYISNSIIAYNSIIQNNILMSYIWRESGAKPWLNTNIFTNCVVEKNIFHNNQYNYEIFIVQYSENYLGVLSEIFVNPLKADKYLLNETSIAKGKGVGGVDCGPYGGDDPYCPSGIIMIPTIVSLSVPTKASSESGLEIKIKIKSSKP